MERKIKLTLIKSMFHRLGKHKSCVIGLGLRKINSSVVVPMTPEILGMVDKVSYLLKVENVI